MSVSSNEIPTKDLDVKIMIDNVFLGWLCAVSGSTAQEALYNLYDMSAQVIQRVVGRNGYRSHKVMEYPNTDVKLRVGASRKMDWSGPRKLELIWEQKCKEENGTYPWETPMKNAWFISNPKPRHSPYDAQFNHLEITFRPAKEMSRLIPKEEIENMMVEQFLLGESHTDECSESNEHG